MALTNAQNTALKTHIEANSNQGVIDALAAGDHNTITTCYAGATTFYCWKDSLTVKVIREVLDWSEVVVLTSNELIAFQILTSAEDVNTSLASTRAAFSLIFAAGNSRTALIAAAKRVVNEGEKALHESTGVGTEGDPSTLGFAGTLSRRDITTALESV